MFPLRSALTATLIGTSTLVVASCRASYHPLQAAEACRCSPREYCHVPSTGVAECVPMPARCADSPSCACLGRPIDACREELGAFSVLEPRPVSACDDCSSEEYCLRAEDGRSRAMCGVLPARCEDAPTCDCFLQVRRGLSCVEREGRIEAGPAAAAR